MLSVLWKLSSDSGQSVESAAQANAEQSAANTLALTELQELQTGKHKVCQNLQKAED